MQHIALQRCNVLIGEYQAEVSMYDSSSFVFVDETGCDRRDESTKILCRGKRYSAIGVMSTTSLLYCYITEGAVDGDTFYRFAQTFLLPHLREFNGNSVVIMSIHHVQEVIDLIHSVGALVIFLPPYSPHLMPIEFCFSKVKLFLKEHEALSQSVENAELLILGAFASITPKDCIAWSSYCGYI